MKRRRDPRHLSVEALAAAGEPIDGQWPGASFARLAPMQTPPQDEPLAPVVWRARAERRSGSGVAQTWLALGVDACVWLSCQRCLAPLRLPMVFEREIRFVATEAEAEALDAEIDDDVLSMQRPLDLHALVEDELLLALPIVPRHERCPEPLMLDAAPPQAADDAPAADAFEPAPAAHPFAALAAIRPRKSRD